MGERNFPPTHARADAHAWMGHTPSGGGDGVLVEAAKPVALVLCMAALCGVFYTAFLIPANDMEHGVWDTLTLLSLAAGICVASGMLFRDSESSSLMRTLPVQMLLWGAGVMVVMFVASWYLETHCIFYRDVRRF